MLQFYGYPVRLWNPIFIVIVIVIILIFFLFIFLFFIVFFLYLRLNFTHLLTLVWVLLFQWILTETFRKNSCLWFFFLKFWATFHQIHYLLVSLWFVDSTRIKWIFVVNLKWLWKETSSFSFVWYRILNTRNQQQGTTNKQKRYSINWITSIPSDVTPSKGLRIYWFD